MADVIVLGGGIIGLTAAVRLSEAGADVRVWSPVDPLDTVSAVAAAVWYPTRTDYDPRVLSWAAATYAEFIRQAADGVPGVLLRPTRNLGAGPDAPWWAPAAGEVTVARPATGARSSGQPPVGGEVRFTAPLVEMETYLPWLASRVRLVRRHVTDLAEGFAEAPVVVNATGLAAGSLAGDDDVYPIRGQVVLVENPGITMSVRAEGEPSTYVHPRTRDVVLGGTFDVGSTDVAPDPATRDAILARCRALVPELAGARIVGEKAGLRPARRGGPRLEAVDVPGGRIVHAYGHGGAGMTLSWGCADEVARLCAGP